jgi:hypothetical protein
MYPGWQMRQLFSGVASGLFGSSPENAVPGEFAYLPVAHATQEERPGSIHCPTGQGVQLAAPGAVDTLPSLQLLQLFAATAPADDPMKG